MKPCAEADVVVAISMIADITRIRGTPTSHARITDAEATGYCMACFRCGMQPAIQNFNADLNANTPDRPQSNPRDVPGNSRLIGLACALSPETSGVDVQQPRKRPELLQTVARGAAGYIRLQNRPIKSAQPAGKAPYRWGKSRYGD